MPKLLKSIWLIIALLACPSLAAEPAGLVDQTGAPFDERSLSGGFHLVYFGFTNCPEVCPTSLFEMTAAIDLLPEAERTKVKPVFITLDPARDTSETMARYVEPLGHGFTTVSGDVTAVDRLAAANGIFAVRHVPEADGSYNVDHSSEVLLFGPDGRQLERFPYSMDFHDVARRLAVHVTKAPRA